MSADESQALLGKARENLQAAALLRRDTTEPNRLFRAFGAKAMHPHGHPIAGTEQSGPEAGFATLFDNRWCILTPPPGTDPAAPRRHLFRAELALGLLNALDESPRLSPLNGLDDLPADRVCYVRLKLDF